MTTTVIRLSSPLMSFGHASKFRNRGSAADPTMSSIQGMVAAAAGIGRDDSMPDWIAGMDLSIRTESPGQPQSDYHTVGPRPWSAYSWIGDKKTYGGRSKKSVVRNLSTVESDPVSEIGTTMVTERWYVADATFIVMIDDPDGNVRSVLSNPCWALYAGRKSCPLTEPLILGTTDQTPSNALTTVPTVRQQSDNEDDGPVKRTGILFSEPDHNGTSNMTRMRYEDRNDRYLGSDLLT